MEVSYNSYMMSLFEGIHLRDTRRRHGSNTHKWL